MAGAHDLGGEALKDRLRAPAALASNYRARLSARQAGLALVYHGIGGQGSDGALDLALDPEFFEAQVSFLKEHYAVVAASELAAAARARRRGQRFPVAITFDDDRETHLVDAKPILERVGVTATFFLSGASLERPFTFWWEHFERALARGAIDEAELRQLVPPREPASEGRDVRGAQQIAADIEFIAPEERDALVDLLKGRVGEDAPGDGLSPDQIRELAAGGFEIGFHTLSHHNLAILDDEQLATELTAGREELGAVAGRKITAIAYPGGRWSPRVAGAAADSGLSFGFTCSPVPVTPDSSALSLGRLDPVWCADLGQFAVAVSRALRGGYPPAPALPDRPERIETAIAGRS